MLLALIPARDWMLQIKITTNIFSLSCKCTESSFVKAWKRVVNVVTTPRNYA
jgi:hypothetical protein